MIEQIKSLSNQKLGRMPFFDYLKMFAMFMVLWGHAIQHLQTGEVWGESMHKFIYSFHLPLFMTIAGFFSLSSLKILWIDFLKKKGTQLLLPCLSWGIILYGVIAIMNVFCGAHIPYSPFFVFFQHFWFLKSLFTCYLIAYVGLKICKRVDLWVIVTLVIAHISTSHQIPIMYTCFLIGMLLRIYFNSFSENYKLITVSMGFVYIVVMIATSCDLPLKGINVLDIMKTHSITPPILMYLSKIGASLSSSLFFIGLCYWMSKNEMINSFFKRSWLTEMGRYTLGIYILQSIFLETIMAEYIKVDTWGGIFASLNFDIYVLFPLVSFVIMWFCAFVTKQIQSNRTLSFWLLGNLK